jgi:hypothetical protein
MADKIVPQNIGLFQSYFPDRQQPYTVVPAPYSDNAFVRSNKPNTVFIDPKLQKIPGIFEHEFEHQLNRKAGQRYGENATDEWSWPEYKFWYENSAELGLSPTKTRDLFKNRVSGAVAEINKRLKEQTGSILPLGSRLWTAKEESLPEVLAELSAIESTLKLDFTKDKVLREQIFGGDEKFAQLYRSMTSGRQDRLDAKDLPPYTPQIQEPSFVDYFKDLLFNKRNF